jgi:RimJ/RimL family protein N-acetyltransferase
MNVHFEKASEKFAESYCRAVDIVARERKYLAATTGFPLESTIAFIRDIEKNNLAQFYAIESDVVVGWCDIIPNRFEGLAHVGVLGMGVIPSHRKKGIGKELLRLALHHAKEINKLEKIELEVFKSNTIAISMYEKTGFIREGEKMDSRKIDGMYDNIILMGKKL